MKPSERQASQPNPDATEHQAPSHAEAIKNADKTVDKNAISAKAGDVNATDIKADGKSTPKIDRALAERVNAQVIAKAKAEAKAQTEAKAGAKSGPKAGSDNSAANSKHKTDHETDGSASNGECLSAGSGSRIAAASARRSVNAVKRVPDFSGARHFYVSGLFISGLEPLKSFSERPVSSRHSRSFGLESLPSLCVSPTDWDVARLLGFRNLRTSSTCSKPFSTLAPVTWT